MAASGVVGCGRGIVAVCSESHFRGKLCWGKTLVPPVLSASLKEGVTISPLSFAACDAWAIGGRGTVPVEAFTGMASVGNDWRCHNVRGFSTRSWVLSTLPDTPGASVSLRPMRRRSKGSIASPSLVHASVRMASNSSCGVQRWAGSGSNAARNASSVCGGSPARFA